MTASPQLRRKRTIWAGLAGLFALIAAPVLGYLGWNVLENSKAGTEAKALEERPFPSTPTAMIAVHDDQDLITALAVLVMAPGTRTGGTLVSIPVASTTAPTAGDPQIPVADSLITGGEERLVGDVESLARVTINHVGLLDEATAAATLGLAGDLTATFPTPVVDVDADGAPQELFAAGEQPLDGAQAAQALLAHDPGQPEALRLPNVRAVWNGLAAAIGDGVGEAEASTPIDFADFIDHFFAGPVQVYNDLVATPLPAELNPDGLDVGLIDVSTMVLLMAGVAPSAVIAAQPTLNFRIENGLTQADLDAKGLNDLVPDDITRDMVARLLILQGNVISVSKEVLTVKPAEAPDTTTVLTESGVAGPDLTAFTDGFGDVEMQELPFGYQAVNVVIVVGRSSLDQVKATLDGGGELATIETLAPATTVAA